MDSSLGNKRKKNTKSDLIVQFTVSQFLLFSLSNGVFQKKFTQVYLLMSNHCRLGWVVVGKLVVWHQFPLLPNVHRPIGEGFNKSPPAYWFMYQSMNRCFCWWGPRIKLFKRNPKYQLLNRLFSWHHEIYKTLNLFMTETLFCWWVFFFNKTQLCQGIKNYTPIEEIRKC